MKQIPAASDQETPRLEPTASYEATRHPSAHEPDSVEEDTVKSAAGRYIDKRVSIRSRWRFILPVMLVIIISAILVYWLRSRNETMSSPVIYSVNPPSPRPQGIDQFVTVNGDNFERGLMVVVNYPGGVSRLSGSQIRQVTPTSFEMIILLGIPGSYGIMIKNPDGGHSNLFVFQVT